MIVDKFLHLLDKVKRTGDSTWIACCPVHDDTRPSLAITETKNDSGEMCLLIHCFSCEASGVDVAHAISLKATDLFAEKLNHDHTKKQKRKYFPAKTVFECLARDALLVEICAREMQKGFTLNELTIDMLFDSRKRIHHALSYI